MKANWKKKYMLVMLENEKLKGEVRRLQFQADQAVEANGSNILRLNLLRDIILKVLGYKTEYPQWVNMTNKKP